MATGRLPFHLASVRVEEATLVTLHMKRILVGGSQLAGFHPSLPGQWPKVFVPVPEEERPQRRLYTIRRFEPATKKLTIAIAPLFVGKVRATLGLNRNSRIARG